MLQMHFGARSEHAYPNVIYSPLTLDYFRLQLYNYCWVGMRVRKRELLKTFAARKMLCNNLPRCGF